MSGMFMPGWLGGRVGAAGVLEVPRPGDLVPWAKANGTDANRVKIRLRNAQQVSR